MHIYRDMCKILKVKTQLSTLKILKRKLINQSYIFSFTNTFCAFLPNVLHFRINFKCPKIDVVDINQGHDSNLVEVSICWFYLDKLNTEDISLSADYCRYPVSSISYISQSGKKKKSSYRPCLAHCWERNGGVFVILIAPLRKHI